MTGGVVVYFIPVTTVSETNARGHWAKRHRRTRSQRELARLVTNTAVGRLVADPAAITLTRCSPRTLDPGNLAASMKAVQDGICDSLSIKDDGKNTTWTYLQERSRNIGIRVEVKINPVGRNALSVTRRDTNVTPRALQRYAARYKRNAVTLNALQT